MSMTSSVRTVYVLSSLQLRSRPLQKKTTQTFPRQMHGFHGVRSRYQVPVFLGIQTIPKSAGRPS